MRAHRHLAQLASGPVPAPVVALVPAPDAGSLADLLARVVTLEASLVDERVHRDVLSVELVRLGGRVTNLDDTLADAGDRFQELAGQVTAHDGQIDRVRAGTRHLYTNNGVVRSEFEALWERLEQLTLSFAPGGSGSTAIDLD
jgi:uncharacterized coiled-coil protein SlyX